MKIRHVFTLVEGIELTAYVVEHAHADIAWFAQTPDSFRSSHDQVIIRYNTYGDLLDKGLCVCSDHAT